MFMPPNKGHEKDPPAVVDPESLGEDRHLFTSLGMVLVLMGSGGLLIPLVFLELMEKNWGFPGSSNKESACPCRRRRRQGLDPWVGKIPCRRK